MIDEDAIRTRWDCVLDERTYEKGIKVPDTEMAALDIAGDAFHRVFTQIVAL